MATATHNKSNAPIPSVSPTPSPVEEAIAPAAAGPVVRFAFLRDDDDAHRQPPTKAYPGDAAWDIAISGPIPEHLYPKMRRYLHTNLSVAIPQGYVGLLLPRASVFGERAQCPITVQPQLVYPNYRGELMLEVHNPTSNKDAQFQAGERIAQLLILPALQPEWIEVKGEPVLKDEAGQVKRAAKPADLGKTDRGTRFGKGGK